MKRQPRNQHQANQRGFALLTVVVGIVSLSTFLLTVTRDAGDSLTAHQFSTKTVQNFDVLKISSQFCAQIGTRFTGLLSDRDANFATAEFNSIGDGGSLDGLIKLIKDDTQLRNSLAGAFGYGATKPTVDSLSDPDDDFPSVVIGAGPDAVHIFIDVDVLARDSIEPLPVSCENLVPRPAWCTGDGGGRLLGGASTDCVGGAIGGGEGCVLGSLDIAGGNASSAVTPAIGLDNDDEDSFLQLACDVRIQKQRYLNSEGKLDMKQPFLQSTVSYKHNLAKSPSDF